MSQWRRPGVIITAFGRARNESANASTLSMGAGGANTRGCVAILMKPLRTISETERLGRCDGRLQPAAVAVMVGGACMEGIDQDIDVRQDQRSVPSMRSSNAAESSRSTPGRSLLPAKTGCLTARCRGRRSRLASDSRTASSMTEFSVLPERAASTFSRASSSSSSRMVVLMPSKHAHCASKCPEPCARIDSLCYNSTCYNWTYSRRS